MSDGDRVIVPVSLTITKRDGGAYHGMSDWVGERQEPDTFRRVRAVALIYEEPLREYGRAEFVVIEDGTLVKPDGHWWRFDPTATAPDPSWTEDTQGYVVAPLDWKGAK